MRQDAVPLPYGSLDYYQIHYIVETGEVNTEQFLAKCKPITRGHFSQKRVIAVKWTGAPRFTEILQNDPNLTELLKGIMLHEGEIRVDPLEDHVRIYGKWNHEENLKANESMIEVAEIIAGYIRKTIT